MRLVDRVNPITRGELTLMSSAMFGDLVKAVVDIRREVMAVDAELHADEEAFLLGEGSAHEDLWGINLYPALHGNDFVEFDSMINLRPSRGNRSRGVEDAAIRERILTIVGGIVST
jgi:Protein of unknown function (DUF5674)